MRATAAIAVLALGIAGVTGAAAADLRVGTEGYVGFHAGHGVRADQIVIYDVEPGVVVRSYWLAPWRDRRYFPRTGKKPRVGRRENLAARGHYKPAQSFHRYWSNAAFAADPWRGPPPESYYAPRREPSLK
ncbi:MAG: hypothetical protein ACK4UO_13135 [Pseudolabrys sp.]